MEFSDYVSTIRRHAIAIIAMVLLGALAGFLFARSSPPLYKAASSVFVSANRGENTSDLVQGSVYTQNLMQSYAKLVQTPSVLDPVVTSLNLDITAAQLAHKVSADAPLNTVIIVVTVTDESPEQAAAIANAVSAQLSTVARQLSPKHADGTPGVSISQVGKATAPPAAFSPNTSLLVVAGAGLGTLLALGIVVSRRLVERRINSEADLKAASQAPILGQLPALRRRELRGLTRVGAPRDAFLRLADRVANAPGPAPLRSVVVTSATRSAGKTHVAVNLALAMSEFHGRVLLVDANLRSPDVAQFSGLSPTPGLRDVIQARSSVEKAIVRWRGIWVLPAGKAAQNPTRELNSPAMAKLFIDLLRDFDFVVCDSAPVLDVADSLPLARITDGAVVVARAGKTRRAQIVAAVETVAAAGGELTGLVLNGAGNMRSRKFRLFPPKKPTPPGMGAIAVKAHVPKRSATNSAGDRHP